MTILPRFDSAKQALAFIDDPASNAVITWMYQRFDLLRPHATESREIEWDAQILQLHGDNFRQRPYLGPMAELGGTKYPDPNGFPPEAADYAARRASETRNPVIESRYFDFVYEQRNDRSAAASAIDAYIRACREHLNFEGDDTDEEYYRASQAVECFGRAFAIALDQGFDDKRNQLVREGMRIAAELVDGHEQRYLVLSTQPVEALLMWNKWLAEDQLGDVRDTLERAVSFSSVESFLIRSFFGLIEILSARLKNVEGVTSARRRAAESEEAEADKRTDSGLVRSAILGQALEAFRRVPDMVACARVEAKLHAAMEQSESEMKTVEWSTTLDFTEWDQYVEGLIANSDRDAVFHLLVQDSNLPSRQAARNLAIDLTKQYPLRSLVTNIVIKHETLNRIQGPDGYLDAETWNHYSLGLNGTFAYLGRALRTLEARGKFDEALVSEALRRSELFTGREKTWSVAVERYFAGDFVSFLHTMLPQIEQGFRTLAKMTGQRVTTVGREGQMELKTLRGLLIPFRKLLDERIIDFFEFVLCHERGWNLRNTVTHGIADEAVYCHPVADVVLWVALRMSIFQVTVDPPPAPEAQSHVDERASPDTE